MVDAVEYERQDAFSTRLAYSDGGTYTRGGTIGAWILGLVDTALHKPQIHWKLNLKPKITTLLSSQPLGGRVLVRA